MSDSLGRTNPYNGNDPPLQDGICALPMQVISPLQIGRQQRHAL